MSCIFGIEQSCNECRMCQENNSKTMSNADRIRHMSNAELAENRIDFIGCYSNNRTEGEMWIGDFHGIVNSKKEALRLELKWLESEVTE